MTGEAAVIMFEYIFQLFAQIFVLGAFVATLFLLVINVIKRIP